MAGLVVSSMARASFFRMRGNVRQKDFHQRDLGEPFVDVRKALKINGLRMSVLRERGLREGCKPSTKIEERNSL